MKKEKREELEEYAISMSFHIDMMAKLEKVFDEMMCNYLCEKPDITFKEARADLFHDMKYAALFLKSKMRKKHFEAKREKVARMSDAEKIKYIESLESNSLVSE